MRFIRYQTTPTYIPSVSHSTLRAEMDRLFDVAFPALRDGIHANRPTSFVIDLFENETSYVARAEVPGFHKEDLAIEVADGTLTITAHQKANQKDGQETQPVKARHASRSFALPENLDLDKIQASYEAGVLTVTMPKSEAVMPRQIAVEIK